MILSLSVMAMVGCSETPVCHFSGDFETEANAGCVVIQDNRLLIVEDYFDRRSLPGGTKVKGEAPQCTAEREVWEETGIVVKATERLIVFKNGFHVFACDAISPISFDGSSRPYFSEIKNIHWMTMDQFDDTDWRFPEQVDFMKEQLNSH